MQVEYEVLEAILTIEEAIKAASYIGEDAVISRGDPAAVFATSKNVVSGEVHICVYVCVLILLYVSRTECRERRGSCRLSAPLLPNICTFILLYMCLHTATYVLHTVLYVYVCMYVYTYIRI